MLEIRVQKQSNGAEVALINIQKRAYNLSSAMNKIGLVMLSSIDKNFEKEGRPNKWKSLSPMTISRRRNKDKSTIKILQDTGNLRQSINYQVKDGGNSVAIGTNVQYGKMHQFGATINIPARTIVPKKAKALRFFIDGKIVFAKSVKQKARTAVIPARPFLLFQDEDLEDIRTILLQHMMNENNS